VQELTIEAALTCKKDYIYQAALLDPHTAAELTIDEIISLCDELIEAHGEYLPAYT
jgi:alpha-galactosidase